MEDIVIRQFAELMLKKIGRVRASDYKQPWISTRGTPYNIASGKDYSGINELLLSWNSEFLGYKYPAFMTFKQANDVGARVKRGEKGFPVVYWDFFYLHKETGERILPEAYKKLSEEEKEKYRFSTIVKHSTVFNVDQTTLEIDNQKEWNKVIKHFSANVFKGDVHLGIESMIDKQSWVCPIQYGGNKAYYAPSKDLIRLPPKENFFNAEAFYSVLFHEMAHSTGHPDRLNREMSGDFGKESYAREELIAEMTAAITLSKIGISSVIREENAQYLKYWSQYVQSGRKEIMNLLREIGKASSMITERIALKEQLQIEQNDHNKTTKGKQFEYRNEVRATSYREYKEKVSIMQLAADLGYKPVKGKYTKSRPVLRDDNGDTIIIKNPTVSSQQLYWNTGSSEHGDVINFIECNLDRFNVSENNKIDTINKVLGKYAESHYDNTQFLGTAVSQKKLFREEDLAIMNPEVNDLHFLTRERGISKKTVEDFLPFIRLVNERGYNNIGFPFTIAGEDNRVVGFELRNYGSFKSFSSGGDKINGTWIADFSSRRSEVNQIFFFESAIDAMSFYEVYKGKYNQGASVFVSTGGFPCTQQFANVIGAYPSTAKVFGCHDNDLAGHVYNIMLASVKEGKTVLRHKKDDSIEFILENKSISLCNEDVSLEKFIEKSGLKTEVSAIVPGAKD